MVGAACRKNWDTIKEKKKSQATLEQRDSLCDERRGDRVLHQNWQGDHLAELHSRGVSGPAQGLIHGEPPGAPGHLL